MFRRRDLDDDPALLMLGIEPEPALRDERDPDPLVEAAAERLRQQLLSLSAVDQWGRQVPWRQVARIALGTLAAEPQEEQAPEPPVSEPPVPAQQVPEQRSPEPDATWRAFFRSLDDVDRFLGDQTGALPQR